MFREKIVEYYKQGALSVHNTLIPVPSLMQAGGSVENCGTEKNKHTSSYHWFWLISWNSSCKIWI